MLDLLLHLLLHLSLVRGAISFALSPKVGWEDPLVKSRASWRELSCTELALTVQVVGHCFFVFLRKVVEHRLKVIFRVSHLKRAHMVLNFDHIQMLLVEEDS